MITVVVVEDDDPLRQSIINAVEVCPQCRVIGQAADGEDGLQCVHRLKPDLVISDIRMPRLDGLEMLRILRQEGFRTQIIFLTAHGAFADVRQALRLQASDFLLKPFRPDELTASILRLQPRIGKGSAAMPALQGAMLGPYSKAAIDYISAHYSDPGICIRQIARALEISEGHLSHLFKKETGLTLMGYLTAFRVHTAKLLLSDCRSRVSKVAEQVGYQSLSNFSVAFKKSTGISPSEYQKQNH